MRFSSVAGVLAAFSSTAVASTAFATPPVPSRAHPRIWLTPATLAAMKTQQNDPATGAARAIARCNDVIARPAEYAKASYQGDTWAFAASSCGLAWQLTKSPAHAQAGLAMLASLLDDYKTKGDHAGGDLVVRKDTGYAIRFFGPHAAIAYDWLHDAPGADALLSLARTRFHAWIDWYTQSGYLNDVPGANYHAGYVFAKTMTAIAVAGEDGTKGDAYWADVTDELFAKQIVGKGLAPSGVLRGGDWAEGWQYAPLSVLEYALSARAVEEQGVALPAVDSWASDLAIRFAHSLTPTKSGVWVGGDTDKEVAYVAPSARTLLATIAGPGSDLAASWAASFRASVATEKDECPVFDALADARGAAAKDFVQTAPSTSYYAEGTRNLYARSAWTPNASWAVFTSAPHLVPDHQHVDASNFVFSHGKDDLVVDPSPYGTRSTLTGNALTVESTTVQGDYAPSQTPWSDAKMTWTRATASGVVAARSDIGGAFRFQETPSDIGFARRDWVFLPEGEVVAIDRARTDDASRGASIRFRSPGTFALSGNVATATVGTSKLAIHAVTLSAGTPSTRAIPTASSCDGMAIGKCDKGRTGGGEYAVRVPGPTVLAVHVLDALDASESVPDVAKITDPGVTGAIIHRGTTTYVVASTAKDGVCGATMAYTASGDVGTRHVVFDAPEDAAGRSTVVARPDNGRCAVTITAGGADAYEGRPLVFTLGTVADGCQPTNEKPAAPPETGSAAAPSSGGIDTGNENAANDPAPGGCACSSATDTSLPDSLGIVLGASGLFALLKVRRSRPSTTRRSS
jgi:uncharacterized RmlC-like cupin family protein